MNTHMTRHDCERLYHARVRWQKEQQLIRKKYQIPYKMTYTFQPCSIKSTTLTSKTKPTQLRTENNESNVLPVHCLKCHLNPTQCSCSNGLGEWWSTLQKNTSLEKTRQSPFSVDQEPQNSSTDSPQERHRSFNSSRVDRSPTEQTKTDLKHQYVLLDWNNRLSLLNFLRTTKLSTNLSKMTIKQLQDYIKHHDQISTFNSITDLVLSITNEQPRLSLCQIYIDPSYYLDKQGGSPSKIIADNLNLTQTMRSIENLAALLGVKVTQSLDALSSKKVTEEQRKSLLNQQALLIASNIPYNICRSIPLYTV